MGEERTAVDVADGIEPVVTRNPEIVRDGEGAAPDVDPDRLEPDPPCRRNTAECSEYLVGLDHGTIVEFDLDRLATGDPYGIRL